MKNKIEIIVGSPVEYDELVAYIVIDGCSVALLNQDKGKDNLTLEFFEKTKIGFDTLIVAMQKAKEVLLR